MSTDKGTITAYERAFKLACSQLVAKNPSVVADLAAVRYDPSAHRWHVVFLGEEYTVEYPSGQVNRVDSDIDRPRDPEDRGVPVTHRILMLHYLLKASGTRPSGRLKAFRELPGGDIYVAPFTARTIKPLAAVFGSHGAALVQAGTALGGHPVKVGHYGVVINTLPRVPLTLAVWEGDDEFLASANILFDSTAPDYLPTEDLVVLAGETVRACARLAAAYA